MTAPASFGATAAFYRMASMWIYDGRDEDLTCVQEALREWREIKEDIATLLSALKAVEEWWLTEGMIMTGMSGAPYCIFATRQAIKTVEGQ